MIGHQITLIGRVHGKKEAPVFAARGAGTVFEAPFRLRERLPEPEIAWPIQDRKSDIMSNAYAWCKGLSNCFWLFFEGEGGGGGVGLASGIALGLDDVSEGGLVSGLVFELAGDGHEQFGVEGVGFTGGSPCP